jgi:hypothetical protein
MQAQARLAARARWNRVHDAQSKEVRVKNLSIIVVRHFRQHLETLVAAGTGPARSTLSDRRKS